MLVITPEIKLTELNLEGFKKMFVFVYYCIIIHFRNVAFALNNDGGTEP